METKKQKILQISKELGLAHIGSCLSVLPILEEIYSKKKPEDLVILDGAHAHLAHLMFTDPDNASESIQKHGIHCEQLAGCDVSGGSLGHACGIAIGMALANPNIDIYVIFTDGSIQEGSNWEALRIREHFKLYNIKCYFNLNSYTAIEKIDRVELSDRILSFCSDAQIKFTDNGWEYDGIEGHYMKAI